MRHCRIAAALLLTFLVSCAREEPAKDWLIDGSSYVSSVEESSDGKDIILTNGLVSRVFRIQPNLATTNIINNSTGESFIRTASPEGTITIDGKDYSLGGLGDIDEYGYLLEGWLDRFKPLPDSFQVVDYKVTDLTKRMEWNRKRWSLIKDWDPKGKELIFFLLCSLTYSQIDQLLPDNLNNETTNGKIPHWF